VTLWAVLVARAGAAAKSRLAPALPPPRRRDLALAMLEDVLRICALSPFDACVAIVDSDAAEHAARAFTPNVSREADDMNAAVSAGLAVASEQGARTAIVLPGDIPLVSTHDIQRLLQAAGGAERAVIVGASHDGQGTNALLLRPLDVIRPSFGPPSVERHVRAGEAADALACICTGLDLALDIDTPADLDLLRARHPAGRTGALLRRLDQ
jgi:2-phospho-L-lactate/phosphoenolpyruvate guanylyltransferase